jgi:putative membrane protein
MMAIGSLFWVALLVLVVVVIMRLWPGAGTFQSSAPQEDEALSILRQRYARGEIDLEEFERKRHDLRA